MYTVFFMRPISVQTEPEPFKVSSYLYITNLPLRKHRISYRRDPKFEYVFNHT